MSDYEIIKYILNDINEDLDDEEKVHLLLNKTVSENNECLGKGPPTGSPLLPEAGRSL